MPEKDTVTPQIAPEAIPLADSGEIVSRPPLHPAYGYCTRYILSQTAGRITFPVQMRQFVLENDSGNAVQLSTNENVSATDFEWDVPTARGRISPGVSMRQLAYIQTAVGSPPPVLYVYEWPLFTPGIYTI